eukprot:TRINITY_DN61407_c0_g1_i1.p1 TRINITY_DN61407_c0_g1~~TRINITY_DN61407_c0_g1_i1.p1  ORF type:complete len:485 (-),score=59.80 TRINITY_DN61407_c0_g1_i1:131-1537(-)
MLRFPVLSLLLGQAWSQDLDLSNWMGQLEPVIGNVTLLDLSLPGAHDAMTYDLSNSLSDGYEGLGPVVSGLLHKVTPHVAGSFIRSQSQTQGINLTSMLDAGTRFIDFRIMYTGSPGQLQHKDWYCLHGCETQQPALTYLQQVKAWMDDHPKEIVVFWASRHGSTSMVGTDQYPSTTPAQRQAFFSAVRKVFGDLLFNATESSLNGTDIASLWRRGHRVLWFASDYAESTANSSLALDARLIDNQLPEVGPRDGSLALMRQGRNLREGDKHNGTFFLMSMASSPHCQIEAVALMTFLPLFKEKYAKKCAQCFDIPGMDWCPESLQDVGQLYNYYNQIALETAYTESATDESVDFPHAIYIDGLDFGGRIRTGLARINPLSAISEVGESHADTGYSYAATIIGATLRRLCRKGGRTLLRSQVLAACSDLRAAIDRTRQKFPYQRWNDTGHGRWTSWPDGPNDTDVMLLV